MSEVTSLVDTFKERKITCCTTYKIKQLEVLIVQILLPLLCFLSLYNLSILYSQYQQYSNSSGKIKIFFVVFKENLSGCKGKKECRLMFYITQKPQPVCFKRFPDNLCNLLTACGFTSKTSLKSDF